MDVLVLFLREDILAWAARRLGRPSTGANAISPSQLRDVVAQNAQKCLNRLEMVRARFYVDFLHKSHEFGFQFQFHSQPQ